MVDHVIIIVVAGQHSFSGELENRGLRVFDLLNDPGSEFLQLANVAVHRRFFDGIIKQLSAATIPKAMIDFVLLEQDKHEAPLRRQHGFVEKRAHRAFVVVSDYEICGKLMLKGSPEAVGTLTRELATFFPLTDAQLSSASNAENHPVAGGVALIHKSKVTALQIDQRPLQMSAKSIFSPLD